MSLKYLYSCDHCGKEEIERANRHPHGWGTILIEVTGMNCVAVPSSITQTKMLCGSCQQYAYNQCNPDYWPGIDTPAAGGKVA